MMTYIGMAALVIGCFAFAAAWNAYPKNTKLMGIAGLLMAGGTCIGIGGNPARDMPNGSPPMVVMGFLLLGIGGVLLFKDMKSGVEAGKELAKEAAKGQKIAFYEECVSSGVLSCTSEKDKQKASLLAQRKEIPFTDITALFNESKALAEQNILDQKEAALRQKKQAERSKQMELERYAGYSGRSKRIAILQAERQEALQSAKTLRDGASALLSATQQKEHDWAIHGGIASGIAGPAAGVATALNVQSKNAAIRAQNEANRAAFAPVFSASYSGAADYERTARAKEAEIEEVKVKLLGELSPTDCLKRLGFTNTKVTVSETGTCTVTTQAYLPEPLYIFDDVPAIIDGCITANIMDGKQKIGSATMVLPKYGVDRSTTLTGMSLYTGAPGKKYAVSFTATNLWAMEK